MVTEKFQAEAGAERLDRGTAIDVETTGLDCFSDRLIVVSSWSGSKGRSLFIKNAGEELPAFLANCSLPIIGHNIKFDLSFINTAGIQFRPRRIFDTMVASWLLDGRGKNIGLKPLANKLLGVTPSTIDRTKAHQLSFLTPIEEYCQSDSYYSYLVALILDSQLKQKPNLRRIFYEIEMPLLLILLDMELRGVTIDIDRLQQVKKELEDEITEKAEICYQIAKTRFNLNSPKQLASIIFNSKKATTSRYVLEHSDHPLAKSVLEYRKAFKLYTAFIKSFMKSDGIIHCNFLQTGTITGRLASSNPNLQNIPVTSSIRSLFIPRPGYKLIVADYSSLELRVLAHLLKTWIKKPSILVKAIESGQDAHTVMASYLLNKKEITKEERKFAKTVTFGIIYGMQAKGLARRLEIKEDEAYNLLKRYFSIFPEIAQLQKMCIETAQYNNYIENIIGFRRQFDENSNIQTEALNAVIQSSAAYIVKAAQVELYNRHPEIHQLIQVHDEIVAETQSDTALSDMKKCMEEAMELAVPLEVEIGIGDNWYAAKA